MGCGVVMGDEVLFLRGNVLGRMIGHRSGDEGRVLVRAESDAVWEFPADQIAKVEGMQRVVTLADGEERRPKR